MCTDVRARGHQALQDECEHGYEREHQHQWKQECEHEHEFKIKVLLLLLGRYLATIIHRIDSIQQKDKKSFRDLATRPTASSFRFMQLLSGRVQPHNTDDRAHKNNQRINNCQCSLLPVLE